MKWQPHGPRHNLANAHPRARREIEKPPADSTAINRQRKRTPDRTPRQTVSSQEPDATVFESCENATDLTHCHGEIVKKLLGAGAHVNAQGHEYGHTSLSWAAQIGNEAAVKLFLNTHEVHADKPDGNGRTPLFWATEKGHLVMVKMLVGRRDVNIALEDTYGLTALQLAVLNHHEDVENLLLASNAPIVSDFYGLQTLFGEVTALSDSS
ncbi:hypothetical protein QQZ08_009351 [Neonectria magnoliae]|uniref:Uncharacterized protein n=1 Tax=Neonectria magnoliae TaxID=2732573 RepID=A0ABR1HPH7_9HYPO